LVRKTIYSCTKPRLTNSKKVVWESSLIVTDVQDFLGNYISGSTQLPETLVQVGGEHQIINSSCIKITFEFLLNGGIHRRWADEIIFVIV
jgi:hypothetical protein